MKRLVKTLKWLPAALAMALLLTSCMSFGPIPDAWPKRYREFLQKAEMPFSQRVAVYLGLETDKSPTTQAYGEPIVIYASSANTIWGATVRFGAPIGNVYKGRIWTNFSPSVTCITYDQLKEVGDFRTGNSVPMHVITGPSGSGYVTFLPLPDHFIFKLENGTTLEANVVMEKACLSSLEHNLSSGSRR